MITGTCSLLASKGSRKSSTRSGGYKAIQIERRLSRHRNPMAVKNLEPLRWRDGVLEVVDQTLLPARLTYVRLRNVGQVCAAIKTMKVRGAPLIGVVEIGRASCRESG